MDDFEAFLTTPGSAPERRAAITRQIGEAADLVPLVPAEAVALLDGFLRARELSGQPFSAIELTRIMNWAQFTRIDELLLEQLCAGALGIDVEGPEIVFCRPPAAESFSAASAFAPPCPDAQEERVQLAFAAVRWAAGQPRTSSEIEKVARWVRVAAANTGLLAAFVAAPEAVIDFDTRGRIAIYPPERL